MHFRRLWYKMGFMILRLRKYLRTPLGKAYLIAFGIFVFYLIVLLITGGIQLISNHILIDLIFFFFSLLISLLFFSQFSLPVHSIKDRLAVFIRLIRYMIGRHGPAVFIQDGQRIENQGETEKRRSGILWLDSASAALLRTPYKFTRVVGPGIVFTRDGEFLAGTIDLHMQYQKIGPPDNEDPFLARKAGEKLEDFEMRQKNRIQTQAFTRDGIEVVATLNVSFRLDAHPGEGKTGFGFRADSVSRAISGRPIKADMPSDSVDVQTEEWLHLPCYLALNIWRECLSLFRLSQLFQQGEDQPGALSLIINIMNQRLQNSTVHRLDNQGNWLDETTTSKEFRILQERGLRVINVSVSNLRLDPAIEAEIVQRWKTTWLTRAQREQTQIENTLIKEREEARQRAFKEYIEGFCQFLGLRTEELLTGQEILTLLIQGNQQLCSNDPFILNQLASEIANLQEMIEWTNRQG